MKSGMLAAESIFDTIFDENLQSSTIGMIVLQLLSETQIANCQLIQFFNDKHRPKKLPMAVYKMTEYSNDKHLLKQGQHIKHIQKKYKVFKDYLKNGFKEQHLSFNEFLTNGITF